VSDRRASEEPSFAALLQGSLRVCGLALLLATLAFGLWLALRWLFPEIAWLRGPA
jgi:hypothetical protein